MQKKIQKFAEVGSHVFEHPNVMKKIHRFKPILGMCSQGQPRSGVNDGGLYLYNNVFRNICDAKPYVVQHA